MSVARTYAKALFEAAKESKNVSQELVAERKAIRELLGMLNASKELRASLLGPATSAKEKTAIIEALSKKEKYSPMLTRFLSLLAQKKRLPILDEILQALEEVRLESEGGVLGTLVSSDELSSSDVAELSKAFSKKLGKKVEFNIAVDPELLAGLKVTVNGVTYDGSLRAQLNRLRDELAQGRGTVH